MKPGIRILILGIGLFVVGAFVVPAAFVLPIILNNADAHAFVVPGMTEVATEEPGRYYLWNDFRTVFEGKTYNRSESLPDGFEIIILDEEDNPLPFNSDTRISTNRGSSAKNSIGYVEVLQPGTLKVSISGNVKERVFSFSQSRILKMLALVFGGVSISMLLTLAGLGLAIWGIVKLVKNRAPSPPQRINT